MIEAEREIEGGISVPGAFGIGEHRSVAGHDDVLWADVSVDERDVCVR